MINQYVTTKEPTEIAPDLLDLLGLPGPPETRNAAPAGPRNGVEIANESANPQVPYSADLAELLGLPVAALDRPITVTRFDDATSKRQTVMTVSLRQLADTIRDVRASEKARLPWLKLAAFGNTVTTKGALRHDANLLSVDGIEADYDGKRHGGVTVEEACDRLRAAGLAAMVYTSPSHTPDAPRWRVLCPTSAALPPADRDMLCERVNGALGGILEGESFTRSQAYFYGAVGQGQHHAVHLIDGRAIDVATDVPRMAKGGHTPKDVVAIAAAADDLLAFDDNADDLFSLLEPDWDRIAPALAVIPSDDRDDWLTVGMALHAASSGSANGFEAWDTWSKGSAKHTPKDQARVWASFGERKGNAVGLGSLFHLAEANGWTLKEVAPPKPAVPSRLEFLSPDQCELAPSRGYVVKGILAPGDVGCIFGAPGAGKSLIAPHLGYKVAQGAEAFSMRTKPGGVFYVAAEDPHGMRGRITALKQRHGDAPDFTLVDGVSDLLSQDSADLAALMVAIKAKRPALIFLDTLAMAFPGLEENSADGMGRVVAVARKLTKYGAAVVLIHHDTKAEGSTPRGHSLLNGALDVALHVTKDEYGVVRAKLTKNRNGTCDRDIAFKIDTAVLGIDEDGDEISVALVDELAQGAGLAGPKLSGSERAALLVLRSLTSDNNGAPGAVPVTEDQWRASCIDSRTVSAADSPASRKKAFVRALAALARHGLIIVTATATGSIVRMASEFTQWEGQGDAFDGN